MPKALWSNKSQFFRDYNVDSWQWQNSVTTEVVPREGTWGCSERRKGSRSKKNDPPWMSSSKWLIAWWEGDLAKVQKDCLPNCEHLRSQNCYSWGQWLILLNNHKVLTYLSSVKTSDSSSKWSYGNDHGSFRNSDLLWRILNRYY